MNHLGKLFILCLDNEPEVLHSLDKELKELGLGVVTAPNGFYNLEAVKSLEPELILLGTGLSATSSYEICSKLRQDPATASIPTILLTTPGEEEVKEKGLSVGAVDFLEKPIQKDHLLRKMELYLKPNWREEAQKEISLEEKVSPSAFSRFIGFLSLKLNPSLDPQSNLAGLQPADIYPASQSLGIAAVDLARWMAEFLDLPYLAEVHPQDVQFEMLPATFAKSNQVVVIKESPPRMAFVVSNPFDWSLLDALRKIPGLSPEAGLFLTFPENIIRILEGKPLTSPATTPLADPGNKTSDSHSKEEPPPARVEAEEHPIVALSNEILHHAVALRASDIHLEPKKANAIVRLRIDGDMREFRGLDPDTSVKLITRFKAIAGLDITQKRKPQDGAVEAAIDGKNFKLRMATTSTPNGESLVIRLLNPESQPMSLKALGMKESQIALMQDLANRSHGLILVAGPTGSGKTTTVYSLLSQVDCVKRSLISVEDPVEYRIPFANQQQVNEKAGVTFEALLKSSVRQDPDILFIGEVRDPLSSKIAMDFASTGHLTISTLHTSNATTAIFRLERLGINRGTMADAVIGIIAQKLLKKLCPHCRQVRAISLEERNRLSPFTDEAPPEIALPVGCPQCSQTGYHGREGVFEIITFDHEVSEMVRQGCTIAEIRKFIHDRQGPLITHHALEKLRSFTVTLKDIYEGVLLEEAKFMNFRETRKDPESSAPENPPKNASILVVEDDPDIQKLIDQYLQAEGHEVTFAQDGIDALLRLGEKHFDLVLSEINMPNLDGFKLLEMISQKGIDTPVIFLTGSTDPEDEVKGLTLGALDYLKKPIPQQLLGLRIRRALDHPAKDLPRSPLEPELPSACLQAVGN